MLVVVGYGKECRGWLDGVGMGGWVKEKGKEGGGAMFIGDRGVESSSSSNPAGTRV